MNFFEAQADARRATFRLVTLFVLAVITLIALTDLLVIFLLYLNAGPVERDFGLFAASLDGGVHASVAFFILLIVTLGTLYKSAQLRAGGHVVAEMLGGHAVPQNTQDFLLRRYVNVVEEMAIAAGVPVPRLYVMKNEDGINAFAAGLTTDDAVICVTQGALELLDRDELQGVIAHEFSHILNGDMRLNSHLTGWLHGILFLGLLGTYLLRMLSYGRVRSSSRGGGGVAALAMLGGGLAVIGYGGTFFGNLIKATINRQREYLADASAVQFTRTPHGIAGALKAIGGYSYHSRLTSPAAPQASHFYFAAGVQSFFATHPPLAERIRRVDPGWDGAYPRITPAWLEQRKTEEITDGHKEQVAGRIAVVTAVSGALNQLGTFGMPGDQQLAASYGLLDNLPPPLKAAAREPYSARALVYAMLLDRDDTIKRQQLEVIHGRAEEGVFEHVGVLYKLLAMQPREHYLPLVEMAIPALRALSPLQNQRFSGVMMAIIRADNHISMFEWVVSTVILNALDGGLEASQRVVYNRRLRQHGIQTRVVLSMLAHADAPDEAAARHAFVKGMEAIEMVGGELYPAASLQFVTVNNALRQLDRLVPEQKKKLLEACIAIVRANAQVRIDEIEVIRAIAAAIHCPMPPVVSG
ncbi:MAG: peptidase M48 Ste24p [Gammaproteobacteria bacterium]|nr:MAG: peptidase M48 Ste24p [Gammaproteobacteria bacterium]TND02301.1 MAG: peptidase M48, Ste24p [Gammaproteobacteria bacterium]